MDNFGDKGMCADFAIHDKGTGNPHVHIMLTVRPLKENGAWGAKCRQAYDLDENGQRIPDGKGGWKNHREDTKKSNLSAIMLPMMRTGYYWERRNIHSWMFLF